MRSYSLQVRVYSAKDHQKFSSGEVLLQEWDGRDRLRRAAITWVAFWVAAVVSVFLPLLHFILVPAFVLVGPIASSLVFNQKSVVLGGDTTCPNCRRPLKLERGRPNWPLSDLCSDCSEEVKIVHDDV